MQPNVSELILQEIRSLRESSDNFQTEMLQRVSVIETKIYPLVGNGQPGLVTQLEDRVTKLEHWKVYVLGIMAAVGAGFTLMVKLLIK